VNKPLVSILIPTHRPHYFKKALYCALGQTYENKEILVFDNSQTSEIRQWVEKFSAVQYFRNEDGSPLTNISSGIAKAKGEFIKYIFDDDLIFPHTVETMVSHASRYELAKIGIVTSHRHIIDANDSVTGVKRLLQLNESSLVDGKSIIQLILKNVSNFIGEFSTVLLNRAFLPTQAPRDIFKLFGEDYPLGIIDVPLYISILFRSNLVLIPYELSAFRLHDAAGSNVNFNPQFHYAVTDWLRLIGAGFKNDLIGPSDLGEALSKYRVLSNRFLSLYPNEISAFDSYFEELLLLSRARLP
jgi:glycosyltransferase involved in cell wall biosynthesis